MSFKDMVRFREKFNLNQADAARILGIKNAALVSQWETGFRSPTLVTRKFVKLLLALPTRQTKAILKMLEAYKK